ncbi:inositol monophosphatase family protein [Demequina sp. SYSU T00039]|uniref:3'(2'),5-bisphosphonucleoside 3'(2')-phosphohydrolase n=1 Tax=Demequina lignilytica TaxID=3051663 RepID=A0AAW7M4S6_9MICO|nr:MULTISPECIES: inositol monophosphatase family protein [unclassified Demequina]MDN4477899.1 inositol monophosphatase family protein [Demequina sp. SYSU T00039-1]MDN4487808.1 inositol monophosphatase family protein [Demequina sp. SYSU T00039]MDN4490809.1 inositol monophosphatase family protein [Demequina sp. SYSU T00068]
MRDDSALGVMLARAAGEELLRVREVSGLEGRALGDAGDAAAQALLAGLLAEHRPGDAVLSEEAKDSAARLAADRVWIIDPLDGTREYSEGRADWAVHVALWEAGELVFGAVAIPGEDLVLDSSSVAAVPAGAPDAPVRLAVSRSRPPAVTEPVRAALNAELVPMGSAGVKIAAVVRGQVEAYVHAGGQYQWDSAAPVALARAAGLHTSRIDGSPLVYNGADPYLPDLVVCRPDLAGPILAAVAGERDGGTA